MSSPRKIWLVDDDVVYHTLIEFLFETELLNCELNCFNDRLLAVDALENGIDQKGGWPGVILLDLNMPVMDGWEFLDYFSENFLLNADRPKIYVISSSVSSIDKIRALSYSFVEDYITKPISQEQLRVLNKSCFTD